jgi:hypothetical protein
MAALKAIPQNQFQNCFEEWTRRWRWCIASHGEWRQPQWYSAMRYVALLSQWAHKLYCQTSYVHKFLSINYLLNTAYNYPIIKKATEPEPNTIRCILLNSQQNVNQINKLCPKKSKMYTLVLNRKQAIPVTGHAGP